ncbi:MAG: HD domain-containing protein [Bacteriovorax sp.]|nr:HD domain-containing protein [Bacteriovorax sp.]
MTQILLVIEDKQLGRALQVQIMQNYGLEILVFSELPQMFSMLEILPGIRMIICPEKFNSKICEYLIKNHENFDEQIKVLVIGTNKSVYPLVTAVASNLSPQNIVLYAGFVLGLEEALPKIEVPVEPVKVKPEVEEENEKTTVFKMPSQADMAAAPVEESKNVVEYVAISMKYFLHLPKAKIEFDVYSRIKKDDDFIYNVKIPAHSEIAKTEMERISVRGGKDLYVKKADYAAANEFFSTHFLNRFTDTTLTPFDRMLLNSESYEILLNVFKDSSFTKYSIEIIKELIKSINILLNSTGSLEAFFIGMKQKNLSYGYCHSYLSGFFIFKILENFSWKKDQSKNKILYLALFHDLALHNNRLIEAHHNLAKEFAKLSDAEKQVLNSHADVSASILEKIVKAPKELTLLIREHHGLKQGNGFPESLSLGIGPLSMAWIVIEDFVTGYLNQWQSTDKDKIHEFIKTYPEDLFKELMVKYDRLTYADVVAELQKFIKGLQ